MACAHKELPVFKPEYPIYRGMYKSGVSCEMFSNSHCFRSFLLLTCRRMPTTSDSTYTGAYWERDRWTDGQTDIRLLFKDFVSCYSYRAPEVDKCNKNMDDWWNDSYREWRTWRKAYSCAVERSMHLMFCRVCCHGNCSRQYSAYIRKLPQGPNQRVVDLLKQEQSICKNQHDHGASQNGTTTV